MPGLTIDEIMEITGKAMAAEREQERLMRRLQALYPGWRMELHIHIDGFTRVVVEAPGTGDA